MKRGMFTLLFLGSAAAAFAQLGEISLSFGTSRLRNNDLGSLTSSTTTGAPVTIRTAAETNFRFAIRLTVNSWRFLGHEFGYAYNRGKLAFATTPKQEVGMPVHQGFYDFLAYATPEGSKVRPFAAGGGHFSTFYPPGASVFQGNGVTKFGLNYGGGLKLRVSEIFLVRLDLRDYLQGKPDLGLRDLKGMLHQLEGSAGLAFVF